MDATIFFFFPLKPSLDPLLFSRFYLIALHRWAFRKNCLYSFPAFIHCLFTSNMHFSSIFPLFWQRSLIVSRFFYIYIDHSRAFGTVDHFLEKATIIDLLKLHLGTSFFLILFLAHLFLDLCRWWDVSVGSGLLPTSCTVFGFIPMAFLPFKCWFKMFYLFHPDISRTSNFYICKLCTRHLSL